MSCAIVSVSIFHWFFFYPKKSKKKKLKIYNNLSILFNPVKFHRSIFHWCGYNKIIDLHSILFQMSIQYILIKVKSLTK